MTKRILKTYVNSDGVKVTVFPMYSARADEKTWKAASKYSIYNVGAQASKIGNRKIQATCDSIK